MLRPAAGCGAAERSLVRPRHPVSLVSWRARHPCGLPLAWGWAVFRGPGAAGRPTTGHGWVAVQPRRPAKWLIGMPSPGTCSIMSVTTDIAFVQGRTPAIRPAGGRRIHARATVIYGHPVRGDRE